MQYRQYLVFTALAVLGACGGGGAAFTTPPDPPASTLATLAISPTTGTVEVGGTFQLAVTPRDAVGNEMAGGPAPVYTTSDATKATVSADGVVTGVAAGPVTITATLAWGSVAKTAAATLTVTPPAPAAAVFTSLALTPDVGTVAAGATLQLQAQPRDQAGAAMTGLPAATFTSSATGVAMVSAAGVVTGVLAARRPSPRRSPAAS